jgi:acetyltransferase-like isoleucine patch superfamily enzyme
MELEKKSLNEQLHGGEISLLKRYQAKVFDSSSLASLLRYELCILLYGDLPGGLGYFLRRRFYAKLFGRMGRQVILGKGITLRQPGRMVLGDRVAIDDYVMLDAGGTGAEGLRLEEGVTVSRNSVIQGKVGPVAIGSYTDIGCNCVLTSTAGIYIGQSVLIASNCYLGGGRYRSERLDLPPMDQGLYSRGPVRIGDHVWLGAGAIILDGVSVGKGSIIGAGSVVTRSIPQYVIAAGNPARIMGERRSDQGMGG